LVTVVRAMLVDSLVSVTSTPGMTPPESLIEPRSPPWNPWPSSKAGEDSTMDAQRMSEARILIFTPPDKRANEDVTKGFQGDVARRRTGAWRRESPRRISDPPRVLPSC
jgi:hypothetical protein